MILGIWVGHAIKDRIELNPNGVERRILCIFLFVQRMCDECAIEVLGRRAGVSRDDPIGDNKCSGQVVM